MISQVTRTSKSLEEYGDNCDVFWKPDGTLILVQVRVKDKFFLIIIFLTFVIMVIFYYMIYRQLKIVYLLIRYSILKIKVINISLVRYLIIILLELERVME
jgi:hypothetical protein